MWNYIFYLAYLDNKDPTEYDGTESYISAKNKIFEYSWFPIKKALEVEEEVESEDKKC